MIRNVPDSQNRYGAQCAGGLRMPACGYQIVQNYHIPLPAGVFTGNPASPLGIAIDIGTTTIVFELLDRSNGTRIATQSRLNSQRRWGSDVLSRVRAANSGKSHELRKAIHQDVLDGICTLVESAGVEGSRVGCICVAANTIMVHLFLGLSCAGLGQTPFTPEATVFPELPFYDLFDAALSVNLPAAGCTVIVLPALSAFVGGDVTGGICSLDQQNSQDSVLTDSGVTDNADTRLFIDLGTNAEMVLTHEGRHYCASAAAGPAFEGGSISCGTGCIPGAVSAVTLTGSGFSYETIPGDSTEKLTGICGSGILDFISCALDSGLINPDGSLAPVCKDSGIFLDAAGQIRLIQQDIREIQLAKAAVRAGIDILLEKAGISSDAVSSVVIAGGFGLYLREQSALKVGLLPPSFEGRIIAPGNTALAGAACRLLNESFDKCVGEFIATAVTVGLAEYPGFEEKFISGVDF